MISITHVCTLYHLLTTIFILTSLILVFASPLPNKQLWNGQTIGQLQGIDVFVNGGWWHDVSILAATGDGVETEEARGWNGWWNEQIVGGT